MRIFLMKWEFSWRKKHCGNFLPSFWGTFCQMTMQVTKDQQFESSINQTILKDHFDPHFVPFTSISFPSSHPKSAITLPSNLNCHAKARRRVLSQARRRAWEWEWESYESEGFTSYFPCNRQWTEENNQKEKIYIYIYVKLMHI